MQKLPEHKYMGHWTFWRYLKRNYNIERPTKYCVIFNTWKDKLESFSCTKFDTLDDALDEAKELNKMYSNTLKPFKVYNKNGKYIEGKGWRSEKYDWDFSDGRQFWGYVVFDMINQKFIKVVNGLHMSSYTVSVTKPTLAQYDIFFRGEDEIPEDYLWDRRGEYNGWLQFRWGDGKNAIDYIEPPKKEKEKICEISNNESDIYVEDFEGNYEGYLPCTLAEEIAVTEYVDNGGTFDKKTTTASIANMLGDDNPLLKLKFD